MEKYRKVVVKIIGYILVAPAMFVELLIGYVFFVGIPPLFWAMTKATAQDYQQVSALGLFPSLIVMLLLLVLTSIKFIAMYGFISLRSSLIYIYCCAQLTLLFVLSMNPPQTSISSAIVPVWSHVILSCLFAWYLTRSIRLKSGVS